MLGLCYHAVGEARCGGVVRPDELAWQLGWARRRGYRPARFTDAVLAAGGGERVLAVTFDDGYASVISHALPILSRLDMVGTVFPRFDRLGQPGWLSCDDLERLLGEGWEIGSHTLTHPRLPALPQPALEHELRESKRELERELGVRCRAVAYPLGEADGRVVAAAAEAGYEAGAALLGVPAPAGPLAWARAGIDGNEGRVAFRLRVARPVRRLRRSPVASRLWHTVRSPRAEEHRRGVEPQSTA